VIEPLVELHRISMPGHPGQRCILLPAKNRDRAAREEGRSVPKSSLWSDKGNLSSPKQSAQSSPRYHAPRSAASASAYSGNSSSSTTTGRESKLFPTLQIPLTPVSPPDTSAPSTPGGGWRRGGGLGEDDGDSVCESPRMTAHFPVNLFVTAVADGLMEGGTKHKEQDRLGHIVSKVPKEQNTCVEVRLCLKFVCVCARE
jgi:hypothetical protein